MPLSPNSLLDFSSMSLCFLHLIVHLSSGHHFSKSKRKGSSEDYKLDGNMDVNNTGGKQMSFAKYPCEEGKAREGNQFVDTQWIHKNISEIVWRVDKWYGSVWQLKMILCFLDDACKEFFFNKEQVRPDGELGGAAQPLFFITLIMYYYISHHEGNFTILKYSALGKGHCSFWWVFFPKFLLGECFLY